MPEKGFNRDIHALRESGGAYSSAGTAVPGRKQAAAPAHPGSAVPRDILWLGIFLGGLLITAVWNAAFLNWPAFKQISAGFLNTFIIALLASFLTLLFGWAATWMLYSLEERKVRTGYFAVTFCLNLIRSMPQIVGVLFGYMGMTILVRTGILGSRSVVLFAMALVLSAFMFNEMTDLMRERIRYFKTLDFYNAMRVCGIPESRVINFHILWKSSRIHIFNKMIAVFGMAIFLQCSVDFIISVGLSTQADLVTLPRTLGSLLARIDSKQDILTVSFALTHPSYLLKLFTTNLQGITTAFLIVFSLLSIYHISNGFSERHRL